MPPRPDDAEGGDDAMRSAIRSAEMVGDGDSAFGEGGYDSDEDHRRGQKVNRNNASKGAFPEQTGEEKKVFGKNKVEKVVDEIGLVIEKSFLRFLQTDQEIADRVRDMHDYGKTTLRLDFEKVEEFEMDLALMIQENYYRFKPCLERALQQFVFMKYPEYMGVGDREHQKAFQISFFGLRNVNRLRDLGTSCLGRLLSVTGTVTRSSETRPELLIGAFTCLACEATISGVEQEFKYTEPNRCKCGATTGWTLNSERSQFADWQKLRVQENATEVPAGSMPRLLEVILRHESVEGAKPGDKCVFTGTLIVIPDVSKLKAPGDPPGLKTARQEGKSKQLGEDMGVSGLKALGVRDLSYRLAFLACSAQPCDGVGLVSDPTDETGETSRADAIQRIRQTFSEADKQELIDMSHQPNLIEKMKRSVAPAIYGHGDVKLGVLLLLFGGVHKKTPDGIHLRGDINVCIVGDPSTAKSQFLRYVCSFAPRAVYTSGKASTAAGLTASVMRDPETGEFCIEAGALMLADNGVCCIDEFDKMDDIDQVAIHEAMEQQTISITKAGIQATLNARTSVLAAANPIHGRYDRTKTLKANLTVGPAIMSRFDLFFVVLDECDEVNDRAIADHIVEVHRKRLRAQEDGANERFLQATRAFTSDQMRRYVRFARTIDPVLTPEVQPLLVDYYVKLRQGDSGVGQSKQAYRITVRQLEALVRLSEAIARMHLDEEVKPKYVEKAYQLLKTSIVQVESESIAMAASSDEQRDEDDILNGEPVEPHNEYLPDIRQNELENFSVEILRYMEDRQAAAEDDMHFLGVPQPDVVAHILENCMDINDEADVERSRALVNQVISMLIHPQQVLVENIVPREYEFEEYVPENERRLLSLRERS